VNRHVNAIAGRLSLRPPQRQSLEILDRICEIVPPRKGNEVDAALAAIRSEYPSVTDFEREFPSVCFALATGVGKTRLMGAFISYLHLAHGLANFFVLAPNLTIYNKLIRDFTPNTPKYVFKGIAEFATDAPQIITGDDYQTSATTLFDDLLRCKINIFNISKINSEVRGGRSPLIKRLSEYIGQSYFEYLAQLPDLVLIMDESHRYRASAGVRAINELNPVMGLELTATPFVETSRGANAFRNVILDYPLGRAMVDGFVKEPAVVTRRDFDHTGMAQEEIEQLKLEDGIRLHESVKVQLETYARKTGKEIVKPFLLVIARDTTHAGSLLQLIQSGAFFEGRYKEKVIQVDSSRTGAEEDEMVERLLKVEHPDEPTEIVIHVNMLKEGWDVTNLYTIVPLRAANARVLIEQSIGRGLRLPYGKRTGVIAVDRLNIVAHDRFQEIVDEANRADSAIRLQQVVLEPGELEHRIVTVVSAPVVDVCLGTAEAQPALAGFATVPGQTPMFSTPADLRVAAIARDVIRSLESRPDVTPSVAYLNEPDVLAHIVREVGRYGPAQLGLEGIPAGPDIPAVVAAVTGAYVQQTIDIPHILVVPRGEVRSGFEKFTLDLSALNYPPVSDEIWIQHLRTGHTEVVALGKGGIEEERLEDYVVGGLVDFDDVSYDDHADLLYELAAQVVAHLRGYVTEEQAGKILRCYQRDIARFIHVQMQEHYWEEAAGYDVQISKGFTELKRSAYTAYSGDPVLDYRQSPADKTKMAHYLFGAFSKCLYGVQKFQSEPERKLAVILERDSLKWFRPALGQFQICYKVGADQQEYQPDFVAETESTICMLECKAKSEMETPEALAKRDAAVLWCARASGHSATCGGKAWLYALVPHDAIAENMTLGGMAARFAVAMPTTSS
jgi:type III restriction enzyme